MFLFAHIAPPPERRIDGGRRCCLSQWRERRARAATQKCGSRDRVGETVGILPCRSNQQRTAFCYFARKESAPWSGLICYAWSCGTCLRSVLRCVWSYMAEKSCFPPSRQHFRFTTASSVSLPSLPPGRGGRAARSLFKHFSC